MSSNKPRPKLGINRGVQPDLSIVRPSPHAVPAEAPLAEALAGLEPVEAKLPAPAASGDVSGQVLSNTPAAAETPRPQPEAQVVIKSERQQELRSEGAQVPVLVNEAAPDSTSKGTDSRTASGEGRPPAAALSEESAKATRTKVTKATPVPPPAAPVAVAAASKSDSRIHGTFTEPRFRQADGVETRQTTVTHPLSLDERIDDLMRHNRGRWRTKSRAWCEAMELFLEKHGE